jgi:hypothetical protein
MGIAKRKSVFVEHRQSDPEKKIYKKVVLPQINALAEMKMKSISKTRNNSPKRKAITNLGLYE